MYVNLTTRSFKIINNKYIIVLTVLYLVPNDQVQKNQEELQEDEESGLIPPPKMTVNVVATEPLQLLMTKTCLDVLNQLGQVRKNLAEHNLLCITEGGWAKCGRLWEETLKSNGEGAGFFYKFYVLV